MKEDLLKIIQVVLAKEVIKKMKKFYQFKKASEEVTDLFIFGDITNCKWDESDVGAYDFAKELSEVDTDNITVHINSYGGSVGEGLAIHNLLKDFEGNVTTVCDGFACSVASVIFMSGTKRVMNKGSLLMIHNAWTYAYGNAKDFRKQADDLEKLTEPSIQIYLDNSNLSREKIVEMMDDETWITAEEALEMGFATSIKNNDEANQMINERYLNHQVMMNKELEKQLNEVKKALRLEKEKNSKEELTGWDAFFNTKK